MGRQMSSNQSRAGRNGVGHARRCGNCVPGGGGGEGEGLVKEKWNCCSSPSRLSGPRDLMQRLMQVESTWDDAEPKNCIHPESTRILNCKFGPELMYKFSSD